MISVGLDSETELITEQIPVPRLACLSVWCQGQGGLYNYWDAGPIFRSLIENPDVRISGHNIAYDMTVFMVHEGPAIWPAIFRAYRENRIVDSGIRQKLIDIAGGIYRGFEDTEDEETIKLNYGLGDLSLRLLNRALDKDTWRLRYGELRDLHVSEWPEGARVYPVEDARASDDICGLQECNIDYLQDQYRQARSEFWLALMKSWGLRTSREGVDALAQRTRIEYDTIAADLRAAGLLKPDRVKRDRTVVPGSITEKVVRELCSQAYAAIGKVAPQTKGHQTSIGRDSCQKSENLTLIKYSEFKKLKTVQSTFIPLLRRGTEFPIHAKFETLLETGRTSSKPNVQNLKREGGIRECFVPTQGLVFCSADYGGLELATLAQVCYSVLGYSSLGDALNAGLDAHLEIASQILGITYQEAKILKDADDANLDNARQTGKVTNFGFPGGLGAKALVHFAWQNYRVVLTEERAIELKRIWLARWPEMKEYFRFVNSQVNKPFPMIKHLFSNRYRGGMSYTEACNSYFQGLGSDVAKAAGWAIIEACYLDLDSPLFGFRMCNFVHDEFIVEGPESRAHDAAIELSRIMVESAKPWLPDVRIEAKPQVSRRLSKKAKPVYVNGRLVPWDLPLAA